MTTGEVRPSTRLYGLVDSRYGSLGEYPRDALVLYTREALAFPTIEALRVEMDGLVGALARRHRSYGLLMDMRLVPSTPQPPEFEREILDYSRMIEARVRGIAVLLQSAAGRMQATRLRRQVRSDGASFETMVTDDYAAAWAFASRGATPNAPP